ncbi:MAG: sugar ABC transporter ATP-binding protein [Pseudomonadota bacterium]
MAALVSMAGIEKSFAGVPALRQASLDVEPGEIHALIGQNGAGKSTMIKVLTGVYRRDNGSVHLAGRESNVASPREAQEAGIATIYQELNLVPLRSVTENMVMGYEPKSLGLFVNWREANRRAREVLSRFGIDIDVGEPLASYSTAIQQLVAIARAVSLDAKLVIMDEPTSSLDASEVEVLFGVVRELKKQGVSVLYVSHFLDELFQICDRVTTMRDGQTVSTRDVSSTSKLELIADMLGRDKGEIAAEGMTEFAGASAKRGDVVVSAAGVSTGPRLSQFDLSLHRGEIVGLGGLLGSGRTEAAKALFGVDDVIGGTITIHGETGQPSGPESAIEKGIGFLTEDRKAEGIIPDMSVRENLTLAMLPRLTHRGQIDFARERDLVEKFINNLGIKTAHMDQPIRELSGGNQQKVLLARWLATEPDVLILDEPTRGVDVGAKREIQSFIRRYVEKGFGVVLISSEFEELVEGADRIVVMHEGRSVSELTNPGITENTLVNALANNDEEGRAWNVQ